MADLLDNCDFLNRYQRLGTTQHFTMEFSGGMLPDRNLQSCIFEYTVYIIINIYFLHTYIFKLNQTCKHGFALCPHISLSASFFSFACATSVPLRFYVPWTERYERLRDVRVAVKAESLPQAGPCPTELPDIETNDTRLRKYHSGHANSPALWFTNWCNAPHSFARWG